MSTTQSQIRVTADDYGPIVGVCSIVFILTAGAAFFSRVFTKLAVIRKFTPDDFTIVAGLLLAVAQTVLVVISSQNGLGRRQPQPSPAEAEVRDKTSYAAGILYVLVMVLVKISVALLVKTIIAIKVHGRIALYFSAVVAVWGLASVLGAALACGSTVPPLSGGTRSCYTHSLAFWNAFDVLNMLSDIALVAWPIWVFSTLHTTFKKRAIVIVCFSSRLTAVVATIVQLAYLNNQPDNDERAFSAWAVAMCTQAVQALSITTACVPYLVPFLERADSGLMRSDNIRRRGVDGSYYQYGSNGASRKASAIAGSRLGRKRSEGTVDIPLKSAPQTTDGAAMETSRAMQSEDAPGSSSSS